MPSERQSRRQLFTTEQEDFRVQVRNFLIAEVIPEYSHWECEGRPSREFWLRAGEVGILGIGVPTEYGGLPGSDFRHSVVVTEEAQRLGLAMGGVRVHTDICMPYLLHYATDEQKQSWLPRLSTGEVVIALGLSEPGAGSDLKSMATKAVLDGEEYVVSGTKSFISNGATADLVILAVKTEPAAGRDGISLLLVDSNTPGFERGRSLDKLGLKAQDLAELSFTDMRVPVANLLGAPNRGFSYLTSNLAQERLSIAINSHAAARAALDWSIDTLAEDAPSQHTKFELAACGADVAAGQALIDQALSDLLANELTGADAAVAKLYCTELQGRVVKRCLDLHGPAAYRNDSKIGRAYLDGRVSRIYGGSSEIMKVIVAQQLVKN